MSPRKFIKVASSTGPSYVRVDEVSCVESDFDGLVVHLRCGETLNAVQGFGSMDDFMAQIDPASLDTKPTSIVDILCAVSEAEEDLAELRKDPESLRALEILCARLRRG